MIRSHLCKISNYEFVFYVDKWTCNNMRSLIEYSEAGNPAPPFYNILAAFTIKVKSLWAEAFGQHQRAFKGGHADMYYYTQFPFRHNTHNQLLTPLPAAALLFAALPAYSLTGKRVGGGM